MSTSSEHSSNSSISEMENGWYSKENGSTVDSDSADEFIFDKAFLDEKRANKTRKLITAVGLLIALTIAGVLIGTIASKQSGLSDHTARAALKSTGVSNRLFGGAEDSSENSTETEGDSDSHSGMSTEEEERTKKDEAEVAAERAEYGKNYKYYDSDKNDTCCWCTDYLPASEDGDEKYFWESGADLTSSKNLIAMSVTYISSAIFCATTASLISCCHWSCANKYGSDDDSSMPCWFFCELCTKTALWNLVTVNFCSFVNLGAYCCDCDNCFHNSTGSCNCCLKSLFCVGEENLQDKEQEAGLDY